MILTGVSAGLMIAHTTGSHKINTIDTNNADVGTRTL
jgi:hypothetical protein